MTQDNLTERVVVIGDLHHRPEPASSGRGSAEAREIALRNFRGCRGSQGRRYAGDIGLRADAAAALDRLGQVEPLTVVRPLAATARHSGGTTRRDAADLCRSAESD